MPTEWLTDHSVCVIIMNLEAQTTPQIF